MQFAQTLSAETLPEDPVHDPAGDHIQCHELPSGELLLTFSPWWVEEHDYQVGDVITFEVDEQNCRLTFVNTTGDERASAGRV